MSRARQAAVVSLGGNRVGLWFDRSPRYDARPLRPAMLASGIDRTTIKAGCIVSYRFDESGRVRDVQPLGAMS
jgi:hypothetical protein